MYVLIGYLVCDLLLFGSFADFVPLRLGQDRLRLLLGLLLLHVLLVFVFALI